jgi:hypothetical protein
MAGRLTRIEKVINSQLDSLHVKVVPRGIPYFIDQLLRGSVRFAKRTGNSSAVINTENTFQISEAVSVGSNQIPLTEASRWLNIDSIVSIGPGKELTVIDDVLNSRVVLRDNLRFSYDTTRELLIYASPLKLNGSILQGDTTIQVQSRYPLANGDTFVYLSTAGLLQSNTEVKIKKASLGGTSIDPIYNTVYVLELDKPVNRDIIVDELVYFRAFPAYFSNSIRVPNLFNSSNEMGPFLVDYLSGRLVEGFVPKEIFAIKLKDRSNNFQLGNSLSYETVSKNHPVFNRPISSKAFQLYNNSKGDARVTPNRVVLDVDNSQFRVTNKLVPNIDFNNQAYRFSTTSNTSGKLIIYLEPGFEWITEIVVGNQSHEIVIPAGLRKQMDVVLATDTPNGRLTMTDWTQIGPQVEFVECSIVAESTGRGTWQSTGLCLKPYFMTQEILSGRYDGGDSYDSGFVYF